jgi:hypothetical protein
MAIAVGWRRFPAGALGRPAVPAAVAADFLAGAMCASLAALRDLRKPGRGSVRE